MTEIAHVANVFDAVILPLIGIVTLVLAKFSTSEAGRQAERLFLATLVVMTIITLRTVVACDDAWLVHTTTLATMVVGALVVPSQEPLPERGTVG